MVDVVDPRQESTRSLGEKMIGERLNEMKRTQAINAQTKKARFTVRVGDFYPESTRNIVLTDVYLSVAPGSILGISGGVREWPGHLVRCANGRA